MDWFHWAWKRVIHIDLAGCVWNRYFMLSFSFVVDELARSRHEVQPKHQCHIEVYHVVYLPASRSQRQHNELRVARYVWEPTLTDLSWPMVAQHIPSVLTHKPRTGPMCARKCFTNSIPWQQFCWLARLRCGRVRHGAWTLQPQKTKAGGGAGVSYARRSHLKLLLPELKMAVDARGYEKISSWRDRLRERGTHMRVV